MNSVIDAVNTALTTHSEVTAKEIAERLRLPPSSVGSALRSLWRGQLAVRERVKSAENNRMVYRYRGKQVPLL